LPSSPGVQLFLMVSYTSGSRIHALVPGCVDGVSISNAKGLGPHTVAARFRVLGYCFKSATLLGYGKYSWRQ